MELLLDLGAVPTKPGRTGDVQLGKPAFYP